MNGPSHTRGTGLMKMADILALSASIYEGNKSKGFWDAGKDRPKGQAFALINSELYESLEAHRKNRFFSKNLHSPGFIDASKISIEDWLVLNTWNGEEGFDPARYKEVFERTVKDTVEDELADAIIRICDTSYGFNDRQLDNDMPAVRNMISTDYGEAIMQINQGINYIYFAVSSRQGNDLAFGNFTYVIADILELAASIGCDDMLWHVKAKLAYNATRPAKHGKAY